MAVTAITKEIRSHHIRYVMRCPWGILSRLGRVYDGCPFEMADSTMTRTKAPPQLGDRETQTVEFKETYHPDNPKSVEEMAKDVAAMASARGGTIWIGVNEDQKERIAAAHIPMSDATAVDQEKRLGEAVLSRCFPPPAYSCERVPVNGGVLLAVEVLPSSHQVAVRKNGGQDAPYIFPIRTGTLTQLRQPDLADHATARGYALQLAALAMPIEVALGETDSTFRCANARLMNLQHVDLASLRFEASSPGSAEGVTYRCKDIKAIYPPSGPRDNRWQIDLVKK